jgi:class 3 adenylate cyclase/tetratricopeptide (TPR) repeat protein
MRTASLTPSTSLSTPRHNVVLHDRTGERRRPTDRSPLLKTRTATILFTDTEASTELTSSRGDEVTIGLFHLHERIVVDAASGHGGRVVKSTGDGFLVLFPTCSAGVATALEIRAQLDVHNAARPELPLRVRMGLNVGPVIDDRGDVHGLAVTIAARITAKSRSGQVLVSDAVRVEAEDGDAQVEDWVFVDRGLFWLKGIRERWRLFEVTVGDPVVRAFGPSGVAPFVDREMERAALRRRVDETAEGRGGVVVVVGASGSGKTRLVEEVGNEAHDRGLEFAIGRSHQTGEHEPYGPFVEILETIERRATPPAFRELIGDAATAVSRLLPDLRRRYNDIPPAPSAPANEERRQLFTAMRDVLERAAATRPLVLLFDDLHLADEPSLLLFEHLAAESPGMPLLLVATYTGEELSPGRLIHRVLAGLHRRRLVESIRVGAFSEDDVDSFMTAITGMRPPPDVVQALYAATAGNAFFLEELVRDLSERGRLIDDDGTWCADADGIPVEVPEAVRFTIESRLERLRPVTRAVLTTASLLGRDFGFELLGELSDVPEDDVLDAVDEAERAHVITSWVEDGEAHLAFAHELTRQALAGNISLTRRQRLHLRIADAIERIHRSSPAIAMVHHLSEAGHLADSRRLLPYLVIAGEQALEAAAYDQALGHFDRALGLLPPNDGATRARVLEGMGTAERSLGHLEEALTLWSEALTVYEAASDATAVAKLCLDAAVQVAWWRRGRDVSALVDRGLAALPTRKNAYAAGLLALAGRMASQTGDYDGAERLLQEALAIARDHDDGRVLGITLSSRAIHHYNYCEYEDAVATGTEAGEHLRRTADYWDLATTLGYVGAALGWLGRFDEAAIVGEEVETLARRLGNWSAYVFGEQASRFRDIGASPAPSELQRRGEHALALGKEFGFRWLSSIGHTRIGLAAFWRGEWEEALARFEDAARLEVPGATGGHLGRLTLIHAYLGNRSRVAELVARTRAVFPVPGRPAAGTAWALAATAVEALTIIGERDQAADLYETTAALAATGGVMRTWDFRLVATLQGIAAACAGDWETSESHFHEALQLATALPMRIEEADACRFYASMLRERGRPHDRDEAVRLLTRAAAAYAELGMPRHEALVGVALDAGQAGSQGHSLADQ